MKSRMRRFAILFSVLLALLAILFAAPTAQACDPCGVNSFSFGTFGATTFVPTGIAPGVFVNQPVFVPTAVNPFGVNVFVAGGHRGHGHRFNNNGVFFVPPSHHGGGTAVFRQGPFGGQTIRFRR